MSAFIVWFDQLKFWTVLIIVPLLLAIEYLTLNISIKNKYQKHILINSWQVLGTLFPTFWLLRNAENYAQAAVVFFIMLFFGVYKPAKYKKVQCSGNITRN